MRNPRRTTKRERADVRRSNPTVCRTLGVAAAARLQRQRRMRPEADQLDRFARALGLEPLMTESGAPGVNHWSAASDTVAAELQQALEAMHAATGTRVAALEGHRPVASAVDEDRRMPTYTESIGYEVGTGPNPHITLKYPPHISLGPRYHNGKGMFEAMRALIAGDERTEGSDT